MATGVVPPPGVNPSPLVTDALAAIAMADAEAAAEFGAAQAVAMANPLPGSGTPPAQGAASVTALLGALLAEGNLYALRARLARTSYNLQVI